jgi:hypothetical protein
MGIPLEIVLEQRGYAEDEIKRILALREKELAQKRSVADATMERALRQFDQGAVFPTN